MRYMQIVEAHDVDGARRSYLELLGRRGVALQPGNEIYVETVHRPKTQAGDAWLCYVSMARPNAA